MKNIFEMNNVLGKKLSDLIRGFPVKNIQGTLGREISSIAFDSREVEDGSLFIAVHGFKQDGFKFVNDAIARGTSLTLRSLTEATASSQRRVFLLGGFIGESTGEVLCCDAR